MIHFYSQYFSVSVNYTEEKIWKKSYPFPGFGPRKSVRPWEKKISFLWLCFLICKTGKAKSHNLLINYLITECKHCYCLAFISAICQDILKFLHEIYNLMQCFSFSLLHGVLGETKQNGEHMGDVNEMLFNLFWNGKKEG